MKIRHLVFPAIVCLAGALAAGLTGCGSSSSNGTNAVSQVRALNAVQGGPNAVDIYERDIIALATGVAYGQVSPATGYMQVASGGNATFGSGQVDFTAYPTGTTPTVAGTGDITRNQWILDNHGAGTTNGTYTVALAGIVGQTGTTAPKLVRLIDNPSIAAGTSAAYIRLANLVPDSASTGIQLYNNGGPVTGLSGVVYTADTPASNYVPITILNGQALSLSVRDSSNNTLLNTVPGQFAAGHAYTVFVIGEVNPVNGGHALSAVVTTDL